MPTPPENLIDDIFAEEKQILSEIDFSSLLDLPEFSPSVFKKAEKPRMPEGEKYLVFHLDEKVYGIRSENVLEIIAAIPVIPLPNTPKWLSGISNLRGDIISVVDLRRLWNRLSAPVSKPKFIIFRPEKNDSSVAFIVDRVNEIIVLSSSEINFSAADFEHSFPTFFGKADFKSQSLYLIDIDKVLSSLSLSNQ